MSDFLSLFTYRNLLIVEAAVLVLVLALTLRKPEVITTKSGNTVERPRSRTGLICTLLLLAVTWALHMTGFQLSVIFQKGKNIVAILEKLFRPKWDFFPKVITPPGGYHQDVHPGHRHRLRGRAAHRRAGLQQH